MGEALECSYFSCRLDNQKPFYSQRIPPKSHLFVSKVTQSLWLCGKSITQQLVEKVVHISVTVDLNPPYPSLVRHRAV